MRGKYFLKIRNNRVSYDLHFDRCVTIIKGDSGTGKTNLINMLRSYITCGKSSGITLETNIANIRILWFSEDWKNELNRYKDCIFFADSGNDYILSEEFINLLSVTGSYVVYITRSGLVRESELCSLCYLESKKVDGTYINELFSLSRDN